MGPARATTRRAIVEAHREVIVVTADREVAERICAANAEVIGPSWLLDHVPGGARAPDPQREDVL